MHFIKVHWDKNTPLFNIRNDNGEEELLSIPSLISIVLSDHKLCIGSHMPPEYKLCECPSKKSLNGSDEAQCFECKMRDSVYSKSVMALSLEDIERLENNINVNYINIFGKDLIKVGVTADHRKLTRIHEQGAFATIFFSTAGGYTARRIEQTVSEVLRIKQHMKWNEKIALIKTQIYSDECKNILLKVFEDIKENIQGNLSQYIYSNPEYYYNLLDYQMDLPKSLNELLIIEKVNSKDIISGNFKGIYGDILILENNNQYYGLKCKELSGYELNIEEKLCQMSLSEKPTKLEFKLSQESLSLF